MSKPVRIYSAAEVSAELGVTPAAVSNWRRRHADAPAPDYVTGDGREYWADLAEWQAWHLARVARRRARAEASALAASRRAERAAEAARLAEERAAEAARRAGSV